MSEEENIEEQPTDNNSQPKENENVSEPSTINDQPTTNMEVHKHPHHVMHKKKWGEYLLEFFMLFLAVFLGFLAENFREHSVEQTREKEYMESLVQDLKRDTTNLSFVIRSYQFQTSMQDSLLRSIDALKTGYDKNFMHYLKSVQSFPDFIYSDATIQQLKSSGGFRLIRNKKVIDSINGYTADVSKTIINTDVVGRLLDQIDNERMGLINYSATTNAINSGMSEDAMQKNKIKMLLLDDKITLNKFYNKVQDFQRTQNIISRFNFIPLRRRGGALIALIKKEYHLENE